MPFTSDWSGAFSFLPSPLTPNYKPSSFSPCWVYYFCLWYFFFPQPAQLSDTTLFLQLSLKSWGQLLFLGLSALILFPLAEGTWQSIRGQKQIDAIAPLAFLTGALIGILFFFVNTQMHERYLHSALLLFFLYGLLRKKYALYWLCSIAYFLNLEKILLAFPWLRPYIDPIKPWMVAALYLLLLLWGLGQLYEMVYRNKKDVGLVNAKISR